MGQTITRSAVADQVTELAEHAFSVAGDLRRRAEAKEELRPHVIAALGGLISGAGVITLPTGLEWWMDPTNLTRLDLDLDPTSDTFVDVTRQPWFAVPRDTGRRHVTGPYVDYVCAEQYALTFTVPIFDDGRFAGIAGADVYVADIERALRPALRAVGSPAAVVNSQGRVVAGTSAQHLAGSLIRNAELRTALLSHEPRALPGGVALQPCGALPLTVLTWS